MQWFFLRLSGVGKCFSESIKKTWCNIFRPRGLKRQKLSHIEHETHAFGDHFIQLKDTHFTYSLNIHSHLMYQSRRINLFYFMHICLVQQMLRKFFRRSYFWNYKILWTKETGLKALVSAIGVIHLLPRSLESWVPLC